LVDNYHNFGFSPNIMVRFLIKEGFEKLIEKFVHYCNFTGFHDNSVKSNRFDDVLTSKSLDRA
jgi:hypothetical protein